MPTKSIDLSEFQNTKLGAPCSVATAMQTLDASQRQKLAAAFATPTITATAISRVLSTWSESRVSPSAAMRHRRGECQCD